MDYGIGSWWRDMDRRKVGGRGRSVSILWREIAKIKEDIGVGGGWLLHGSRNIEVII